MVAVTCKKEYGSPIKTFCIKVSSKKDKAEFFNCNLVRAVLRSDSVRWNDKRYHNLDYEMKQTFGQKIIKLSLDGGFTCPNRDGLISDKGCIFCSEMGTGEFAGRRNLSITEQIAQQKQMLSTKWPSGKYIAYFQNFTNTYAPEEKLQELYLEALSATDIVGLAVATRPDCLPPKVVDLLGNLAEANYLWVELGLQTIHKSSATFIRRGYDLDCFIDAVNRLKEKNIRVVVHLILGLPGESTEDMLETVKFIGNLGVWGVKLHLLHILRGTDLYEYYRLNPFPLLSREQYISIVCDALELLPPSVVVHRVTGDGAKYLLEAPKWSLDKLRVLSGIDKELATRDSYQGRCLEIPLK